MNDNSPFPPGRDPERPRETAAELARDPSLLGLRLPSRKMDDRITRVVGCRGWCPIYTGSTDVALTLLPPGWKVRELGQSPEEPPRVYGWGCTLIYLPGGQPDWDSLGLDPSGKRHDGLIHALAWTLPVAITVAGLIAHSRMP